MSDGVHSDSTILIVRIRNTTMDADALHFLQREYRATVVENRTSLTPEPLLTVAAVDPNLGEAIMYRILNPRPEFVIGAGSGLLSWTGIPLDRELTPHIKLVVQVDPQSLNFYEPLPLNYFAFIKIKRSPFFRSAVLVSADVVMIEYSIL